MLGAIFLVGSFVRAIQAVRSRFVKVADHEGVSRAVEAIRFNRDFPASS